MASTWRAIDDLGRFGVGPILVAGVAAASHQLRRQTGQGVEVVDGEFTPEVFEHVDPVSLEVAEDVVHQWFEQALVETILGIQQLRGSKEWGPDEIDKALSPESLTSAVMQRYHVYIACRRDLGAKVGRFGSV